MRVPDCQPGASPQPWCSADFQQTGCHFGSPWGVRFAPRQVAAERTIREQLRRFYLHARYRCKKKGIIFLRLFSPLIHCLRGGCTDHSIRFAPHFIGFLGILTTPIQPMDRSHDVEHTTGWGQSTPLQAISRLGEGRGLRESIWFWLPGTGPGTFTSFVPQPQLDHNFCGGWVLDPVCHPLILSPRSTRWRLKTLLIRRRRSW